MSERITLKENRRINDSLNDSTESNISFYKKLDDDSKKDILFLINSGYNKKQIIKLYILMKPSNVNEAIFNLSKENGKYQHPFFPSRISNDICEICGNQKNMHIKQKDKLITISDNSSISSIRINNINSSLVIKSKESEICAICEDIIPKKDALKNECHNCDNFFCDECLYLYIKELIRNGKSELCCPNCKIEYDKSKIENILSNNFGNKEEKNMLLRLYEKNIFKNKIISNPNLIFCPIPDCEGYSFKNNSPKYNTCNKGHQFCIRCGELWHNTGKCPEEEKLDGLFQKYYERLQLKKCPSCQMMTMKRGGCNHINCTYCKNHWCWICGELLEDVNEHYGNNKSKCYQKMNADIIENDICSKCDNVANKYITFNKCQHIICYNCLEQYLLENEIEIDDNMELKCISESCNNSGQLEIDYFIDLIKKINCKTLINKYSRICSFNQFRASNILKFFCFGNIYKYNSMCFSINSLIFCIKPWRNCYSCIPTILEILYIAWLIIFQIITFYIMPISFQIYFRNFYYTFVTKIILNYHNKILIFPIIIGEELLTLIYFIPFGVLHYFYLGITTLTSIFCERNIPGKYILVEFRF